MAVFQYTKSLKMDSEESDYVHQYPPKPRDTRNVADNVGSQIEFPEDSDKHSFKGKSANNAEWAALQALLAAGYSEDDIQFQVGFFGGRFFKGGIVLDILLLTRPLPTPIWVNGEYWHSAEQAPSDWIEKQRLYQELPGQFAPPVDLWGSELQNAELALWAVLDKVGRK